jgi:uncharacterized protein YpmS
LNGNGIDKVNKWGTAFRFIGWIVGILVALASLIATASITRVVTRMDNLEKSQSSLEKQLRAEFVTRTDADQLYMHMDVSMEKWTTNDKAHVRIEEKLGKIDDKQDLILGKLK